MQFNNEIEAKLKAIKMIVFDIDGTLVAHQKQWDGKIDPKHWDALKQLKASDYIVVLASARTMVTIDHLHQNPYIDYFIGGNGAFIYDCKLAKIVDEQVINGNEINNLLKNIDEQLIKSLTIYTRRQIYTNALVIDPNHYILKPFAKQILPIQSYQNENAHLVVIENQSDKQKQFLVTNLIKCFHEYKSQLTIQASSSKLIMLANQGITKLSAIAKLAKMLNLGLENVLAFGDSANDIEMLGGCAIGIVMKNASKPIYQYGDLISVDSAKNGGIFDTLVALKVIKSNHTILRSMK